MSKAEDRLEVEMKFPVPDFKEFQVRLKQLQGLVKPTGTNTEVDRYFNAPDRDFAHTDEAFRLRTIGKNHVATYKGPKLDAQTKTRKEIEVAIPLSEYASFCELLLCLKYREVATVRKKRRIYHWTSGRPHRFPVDICLDEVEDVGTFVELETIANPAKLDDARSVILKLASELSLGESVRRSYLEMFLEKKCLK